MCLSPWLARRDLPGRTLISVPPSDQRVIKGTTATLDCNAQHDPRVDIRYHLDQGCVCVCERESEREKVCLVLFVGICMCACICMCVCVYMSMGPNLHPAQYTFYTDACVVAGLQLGQSILFPPPPRVGKLGNDLAQGWFGERRRCVLSQMFPGAIFQFQKTIPPQTRKYLV